MKPLDKQDSRSPYRVVHCPQVHNSHQKENDHEGS